MRSLTIYSIRVGVLSRNGVVVELERGVGAVHAARRLQKLATRAHRDTSPPESAWQW
jgi:hypothetical protein